MLWIILLVFVFLIIPHDSTADGNRVDIAQCFSDNIPKKIKNDYEQCYEKARGRYGLKIREALMCVLKQNKLLTDNGDVDMESYVLAIDEPENTKFGQVSTVCQVIIKVKQFISCILVGLVRSCNNFDIAVNTTDASTDSY